MKLLTRKKPSPILNRIRKYMRLARGLAKCRLIKGIPQPAPMRVAASMTVEAAVVIPLFLFFFMNLMSAVEMMRLHGNLQMALWEQGRIIAVAGYLTQAVANQDDEDREEKDREGEDWEGEDQEDDAKKRNSLLAELGGTILLDYGVKTMVVQDLGKEYLEQSPLTYGTSGLQIWESSYTDNECIDIKVTYQVSPMFQIPGFQAFRMANRYYAKAWTGYQVAGEDSKDTAGDTVYVTPYGEVYHVNLDCRHLKRTIQRVQGYEIASMQNHDGAYYVSCGLCMEDKESITQTQWLYVTSEGDRYHGTIQCPALKRTIQSILRYEAVKDYKPCSSCAGG